MPFIELRKKRGEKSSEDIIVSVQDKTFEYLMTTITPEVRISAYFDRDYDHVDAHYEEVFVMDTCKYDTTILSISPGSRIRKGITLPGPMENGEQLTIMVNRKFRDS